jgi:UDP-N-acetylglucosamine 2-epimerase (non-hydrolysing)
VTGDRRRVLVVVGTRPEAIKMAPVMRALEGHFPRVEPRLLLTGQHTDLVDDVLSTFELVPHWDLGIMKKGQSLTRVTRDCLAGMENVVFEWHPEFVLVQGDTASAFVASLSSYFHGIATGHVEAGLRTGDLWRPFPEEAFRRMADVLADLHFAPTEGARDNLLREGIRADQIHVTGNTVVDALLEVAQRGEPPASEILQRLLAPGAPPFFLLTAHRRESFGAPIERIFAAVRSLVEDEGTVEIVVPVHPNPSVTEPAERLLRGHPRIHLIEPLSYPDLVAALAGACGVLTDSGGIQEEAPTFGTPILVLREVSERPEVISAGLARLVGTDPALIVEGSKELLRRSPEDRARARRANPFGDGKAAERIAALVEEFLLARGGGSAV